jgi:hypothetical protein
MRRTRVLSFCLLITTIPISGCTSGLPAVEVDLNIVGRQPMVYVSACHPGESLTDCHAMHFQAVYPSMDPKATSTNVSIDNVPSSVKDLPLILEQTLPDAQCMQVDVHLNHNDVVVLLTVGDQFALTCAQSADCTGIQPCTL